MRGWAGLINYLSRELIAGVRDEERYLSAPDDWVILRVVRQEEGVARELWVIWQIRPSTWHPDWDNKLNAISHCSKVEKGMQSSKSGLPNNSYRSFFLFCTLKLWTNRKIHQSLPETWEPCLSEKAWRGWEYNLRDVVYDLETFSDTGDTFLARILRMLSMSIKL